MPFDYSLFLLRYNCWFQVQQPGPPAGAPGMYPPNPAMQRWGPPPGPPTATGFSQQVAGTFPPPPVSRDPGEQPGVPPLAGRAPYADVSQGPRPPASGPSYAGQMPPPQQPVMQLPDTGPQAMMNMGFAPTPVSDSPTPAFPGVAGQPMPQQHYNYNHAGQRFPPPLTGPAGPHNQINASSGAAQQPQPRRLDPDQMPSPVCDKTVYYIYSHSLNTVDRLCWVSVYYLILLVCDISIHAKFAWVLF